MPLAKTTTKKSTATATGKRAGGALRNAVSNKGRGNRQGAPVGDEFYDYLIPVVIGLGLTSLSLTAWFMWPRSPSTPSPAEVASTRAAPIYDDLASQRSGPRSAPPLRQTIQNSTNTNSQQLTVPSSVAEATTTGSSTTSELTLREPDETLTEEPSMNVKLPSNGTEETVELLPTQNGTTETDVADVNSAEITSRQVLATTNESPDEETFSREKLIFDPSLVNQQNSEAVASEEDSTAKTTETSEQPEEPSRRKSAVQPSLEEQARRIVEDTSTPTGQQVARALPVNPDELTRERVAAYQVALERMHFSCGFVDGDIGMRTQRVLRAFQSSRGLSVTGELDRATRDAIGEPGEPFTTYKVTQEDMEQIEPTPTTWIDRSKRNYLGFNDSWEMLAEKFQCTIYYLKQLNPDVKKPRRGTVIIGPKVFPTLPIPKAASFRVILGEASMQALDKNGRIIAHFPCSIARSKDKRPSGTLRVKNMAPMPTYLFRDTTFPEIAKEEGIKGALVLPAGPNNPVGTAWVGLNLPGYGMHGTPEPEHISATGSAGCFRLANWNANKMLKMVDVGMEVKVLP